MTLEELKAKTKPLIDLYKSNPSKTILDQIKDLYYD